MDNNDLQQGLDRLEEMVKAEGPARKEELLSKAAVGQLDEGERDELFTLLGSAGSAPEGTFAKSMRDNERVKQALDVSEYLAEQHGELTKSLDMVESAMQQSDQRQHEQFLVLGKAIHDIGSMVKSMSEQIGVIGDQPARAPKSRGVQGAPKPLEKSFAGQPPEGEQLSKSEVMDTLDIMHRESIDAGGERRGQGPNGEDLLIAISKFETSGKLSPALHAEVMKRRAG
jgi:hypothetical protein